LTSYTVTVVASSVAGASQPTAKQTMTLPSLPNGLAAQSGPHTINFSWQAPSRQPLTTPNIYEWVSFKATNGVNNYAATCDIRATTCSIGGLRTGTNYVIAVVATAQQLNSPVGSLVATTTTVPTVSETVGPFLIGSSWVSPKLAAMINNTASAIVATGMHTISLAGYTDTTGSSWANQSLSVARAKAVAVVVSRVLATLHYRVRIVKTGYGSTTAFGSQKTAAGRALDRCVVLTVTK